MRKTLFLLCASLLTIVTPIESVLAQTKKVDKQERKARRELLMSLRNEKEIDVVFDMSKAEIHGKSEADFVYIEDVSSTDDWAALKKAISALNSVLRYIAERWQPKDSLCTKLSYIYKS